MRINPYQNYNYLYTNKNALNSNVKKTKSPSFGSICADANEKNQAEYAKYVLSNPDFSEIKCSSTRIFRELSSELAISKLLNPDEKTEIKVMGSADGSEAWAYAIAIKEAMGDKAKNVNIQGVDRAPYMTDLSNTGCLVLSNIEKKYADGKISVSEDESPLKGDGWNKYLTRTKAPKEFTEIKSKYPCTRYMEWDPIVGKRIGSGLGWWQVNKEELPEVEFECADMRNAIAPSENTDNEVYVLANSAGYLMDENPQDFVKLLFDIKEQNKDKKNVYMVLGSVEENYCLGSIRGMRNLIDSLGFKHVPKEDIEKLGIKGSKYASSRIYKLEKTTNALN